MCASSQSNDERLGIGLTSNLHEGSFQMTVYEMLGGISLHFFFFFKRTHYSLSWGQNSVSVLRGAFTGRCSRLISLVMLKVD